jgi:two-component system sensor histidine kinase HydH
MAVLLEAGAGLNYRTARATVDVLNRGQADLLERDMRGVPNAIPTSEELAAIVDNHSSSGLRYAAVLDSAGVVVVEAGTRVGNLGFTPGAGNEFGPSAPLVIDAGERVRAFVPRPAPRIGPSSQPSHPEPDGDEPDGDEPDGDEPFGGPPRREFWNAIEFESLAAGLVASSRRSLAFSTGGAMVLTLAALLFWHASLQHEEAERGREQQRRLSVLGGMSAVLAHEIRNPLASLKGNAQLLAERTPEGSRERQRAERVVTEAQRLEALTGDLLDFARSGPIERVATDPGQLLRLAAEDAGGGSELRIEGAPNSWPLDAARVRQALANLILTARQMSPEDRPPVASISRENGRLIYEVRDFGPGLPEGGEERIFEPFFTTRTTGTGLGLAVARRVAEMHGGSISATTHPQGGALFRIELPSTERV